MRTLGILLPLLLCAVSSSAQLTSGSAPAFGHDALSCMSTEAFPVVDVTIDSTRASTITEAKVYFRAQPTVDWYFVDMEPYDNSILRAFLPKPLADTTRVDYHVFFLTDGFGTSQSQDYSVHVSTTGCAAVPTTVAAPPTSITLGATVANQSPIPAGFQPQGIGSLVTTAGNSVPVGAVGGGAASGGLSGTTVGVVVGAAGAGAAGAVVGASGSDDDAAGASPSPDSEVGVEVVTMPSTPSPTPSPTPTPPPAPTPPPTPSVPDISGRWFTTDVITASCEPSLLGRVSDTQSDIEQDGSRLRLSRNHVDYSENHSGTIDAAGVITLAGQFVDGGDSGTVTFDATTTNGSDMTGVRVHFYPAYNCTIRARVTGSKR